METPPTEPAEPAEPAEAPSALPRATVPAVVWVLVGVTAAIVVAAVVLVATGGGAAEFDRGSPERVVQEFVGAILDRDAERARSLMVAPDDRRCGPTDVDPDATARVVLVRTERDGDRATVTVTISGIRGFGLLGPDEEVSRADFTLIRADGAWQLTDIPWPFAACTYEVPGK